MTEAQIPSAGGDRPQRQPLWTRVGLGKNRVRRAETYEHHTGGLVLAADVGAVVTVGLYEAVDHSILKPSLPTSNTACLVGVALVLLRMALLVGMLRVVPRIWGWITTQAGGGAEVERYQVRNANADRFDADARRAFANVPLYWGAITVGLLGYSLLVTVTGGPFLSPLAPLMLAGFYIGQVRATSKENIALLFGAGAVAVLAPWQIVQRDLDIWFIHVKSGLTYPGRSYLPAAFVVAIMTTVINLATFVKEPDGTGGPASVTDPAPGGVASAPPDPAPASAKADEDGNDGPSEPPNSPNALGEPEGPSTTAEPA